MPLGLSLAQLCGQLLVCGWDGTALSSDLTAALAAGERGGIIAFRRNLPTLDAALGINEATRRAAPAELPPFTGVDEEGGRVSRVPAPARPLPPMRRLGSTGDRALCGRAGAAVGRLLGALGYSIDFAPVLDVDSNPDNPVIGDRAFSSRAAVVADLGLAFADGLEAAGVAACGKHYPGHGDTHLDSHLELPTVAHEEERLRAVELVPFAAAARMSALMSAHVVFERLDPGVPATLSRRIATALLRNELGFRGVLFSDDLEMRALSGALSIEVSAVRAVEAGCDVLLICRDPEAQRRAHVALIDRAAADPTFRARCVEAAERGLALRRRTPPRPAGLGAALAGAAELSALIEQLPRE